MTEFGTVTQVGRSMHRPLFLGVSHVHISRGRDPNLPYFFESLPTLNGLTYSDEIW